MASYEVGEILQNEVQVILYPSGSYTWFRVFVRPSSSDYAVYDEYLNFNSPVGIYVGNLAPGTSYTINVAYGTTQGSATNWIGSKSFTTQSKPETVTLGIVCEEGVYSVSVSYVNEYGNRTSGTFYNYDANPYVFVEKNTVATVTNIEFMSKYSHPVNCRGTTRWQMTNESGGWVDRELQIFSSDVTFRFTATATSASSIDMKIVLGGGISSATIRYTDPDNNTYDEDISVDTTFTVKRNTTHYVLDVSVSAGYKHPVTCTGTTTWQMTNESGGFTDNTLQVFEIDQTFTLVATVAPVSSGGYVWINGKQYRPCIYHNGEWHYATAYIYSGSKWCEVGIK